MSFPKFSRWCSRSPEGQRTERESPRGASPEHPLLYAQSTTDQLFAPHVTSEAGTGAAAGVRSCWLRVWPAVPREAADRESHPVSLCPAWSDFNDQKVFSRIAAARHFPLCLPIQ